MFRGGGLRVYGAGNTVGGMYMLGCGANKD